MFDELCYQRKNINNLPGSAQDQASWALPYNHFSNWPASQPSEYQNYIKEDLQGLGSVQEDLGGSGRIQEGLGGPWKGQGGSWKGPSHTSDYQNYLKEVSRRVQDG